MYLGGDSLLLDHCLIGKPAARHAFRGGPIGPGGWPGFFDQYRHFGLCSTHCRMRSIAAIDENFGISVVYMTWSEQHAIENVGNTGISVRNIDV